MNKRQRKKTTRFVNWRLRAEAKEAVLAAQVAAHRAEQVSKECVMRAKAASDAIDVAREKAIEAERIVASFCKSSNSRL